MLVWCLGVVLFYLNGGKFKNLSEKYGKNKLFSVERGNEDYVRSLGMSVFNLSKIIPDGLLVFFPSYPIMQNCQEVWQMKGIWSNIYTQKVIYAFNTISEVLK